MTGQAPAERLEATVGAGWKACWIDGCEKGEY